MLAFLQEQLYRRDSRCNTSDVGTVISIGDGIASVYGCEGCLAGELLEFTDGSFGLALTEEFCAVTTIQGGNIPVGECYRGRMVNALGSPVDGRSGSEASTCDVRLLSQQSAS